MSECKETLENLVSEWADGDQELVNQFMAELKANGLKRLQWLKDVAKHKESWNDFIVSVKVPLLKSKLIDWHMDNFSQASPKKIVEDAHDEAKVSSDSLMRNLLEQVQQLLLILQKEPRLLSSSPLTSASLSSSSLKSLEDQMNQIRISNECLASSFQSMVSSPRSFSLPPIAPASSSSRRSSDPNSQSSLPVAAQLNLARSSPFTPLSERGEGNSSPTSSSPRPRQQDMRRRVLLRTNLFCKYNLEQAAADEASLSSSLPSSSSSSSPSTSVMYCCDLCNEGFNDHKELVNSHVIPHVFRDLS